MFNLNPEQMRTIAQKIKLMQLLIIAVAAFTFSCTQQKQKEEQAAGGDGLDRTVLPIKEPARQTYTELDVRNATAPPRFEVKAPAGAPNVVVILIDDMGFGVFHTTSLCSPTRVALLTGYNHHSNNAGSIMETSTAFPGNNAVRPQSITPMAEVLRQNGYNTAAFGKYHETPPWEISNSGPQDRWPTRSGFEKFYGSADL
jgi:hypothetical protein